MKFAKGNPGKPKGAVNKLTQSCKQALTEAFEELGGVPSLVAFGQENPAAFYALWSKILPKEVEVAGKDGERLGVTVKFGDTEIPL